MGLKDLFKKSKSTVSSLSGAMKTSTEDMVNKIYNDTAKKIQEGLSKETASTGTPMKELKGAALFTATMSNIGDGSKASGGGGMEQGLKTVTKYGKAEVAKKMLEQSKMNQKKIAKLRQNN